MSARSLQRHLAIALWILSLAGSTSAQSRPRRPPRPVRPAPPVVADVPAEPTPAKRPPRVSLESRLGISIAERLLRSSAEDDRIRGIERLGAVGTTRALEVLVEALEPSGAARGARERLTAVRALAPHSARGDVRRALARLMTGSAPGGATDQSELLVRQVRDSAALALAASALPEALDIISKALRQQGPIAEAAALAIEAHPPGDIQALLRARGAPTPALARVLGVIGDQRAFHLLRDFVKRGAPEVRSEAALALTRLGDLETVLVARHWLAHERDPGMRIAAARILAQAHAPDAARAISALLGAAVTRTAGLELALEAPSAELVLPLSELAPKAEGNELTSVLSALGRSSDARAASLLATELKRPERAGLAAYALATFAGEAASDELERALGQAQQAPLAVRAIAVRSVVLGVSLSRANAFERLLGSREPRERAAAAWALSVLEPDRAAELVTSSDPDVARAAARTAFVSARAARAAANRLGAELDPLTRAALAASLAHPDGRAAISTRKLFVLLEQGNVETPLIAFALATRDHLELRPRIEALLQSGDALLRAHVALGLGESPEPSAIGLLERAYRFEVDPSVRRAIVRALGQRHEPAKKRLLWLAATLEPDPEARETARIALSGARIASPLTGPSAAWLSLLPNSAGLGAARRPLVVVVPGGLALPVVSDPDGIVALARLARGPVSLRLAPSFERSKARNR